MTCNFHDQLPVCVYVPTHCTFFVKLKGVSELCQKTEKVAEEAMGRMKVLKAELAGT